MQIKLYRNESDHHQTSEELLQEHGSKYHDFFDNQLQRAEHGEYVVKDHYQYHNIAKEVLTVKPPVI